MLSVVPSSSLETRPATGRTGLSQLKYRTGSDLTDFRTGKQETSAISSLNARSCFIVEKKIPPITTIEMGIDNSKMTKVYFPLHSRVGSREVVPL